MGLLELTSGISFHEHPRRRQRVCSLNLSTLLQVERAIKLSIQKSVHTHEPHVILGYHVKGPHLAIRLP
jgi:hypothetical protein